MLTVVRTDCIIASRATHHDASIRGVPACSPYRWRAPDWRHDLPTWVLTHRRFPARTDGSDVRFAAGPVAELYQEMVEAAGGQGVWLVGGGDLAGQFADHGLLDAVQVSVAPVTLGAGAPLVQRSRVSESLLGGRSQLARASSWVLSAGWVPSRAAASIISTTSSSVDPSATATSAATSARASSSRFISP